MSINDRMAANLVRMLAKDGFSATIQKLVVIGGELGTTPPQWQNLATVLAAWDNPTRMWKGVNDGAPAVGAQRRMTIAYRDDLKDPSSGVGLRVVVNGVASNILTLTEIGSRVGLRLMLDMGTEP